MQRTRKARSDRQAGSVLVLAMLVTLVILGVGLAALFIASSGMKVSGNISRRQEALGAAETGLEKALTFFRQNADVDWDPFIGDASGVPCTATAYDAHKGNILCIAGVAMENQPVVNGVPTGLPASYGTYLSYTVWVKNDPTEAANRKAAGGSEFDDEDKRVVVRAEGVGRDGISFFAIEAMIAVAMPGGGAAALSEQAGGGPGGANSQSGTRIAAP